MSASIRTCLLCVAGLFACGQTACNLVPHQTLQQSRMQALELHQQNQLLAADRNQIAAEKQRLERQTAGLRSSLSTANQRVDNLKSGLSTAQERYVSLLNRARNAKSPLSDAVTRRFQDLDRKYPEFEFDPHTGVSKFHSDILFSSGSAQIKTSAVPLIQEFANIMNVDDAKRLNILVVGHTDDRPIRKRSTATRHPTNWHLSTHRAISVMTVLRNFGIGEDRMAVMGFGEHRPLDPNPGDSAKARNRRVEIYVVPKDAVALADAGQPGSDQPGQPELFRPTVPDSVK
ncbi:MAG: OmpA family protein [Planctomycetes bacterium]|nr:OmpA family protein [Planctomycetota bacterium]